MDGEDGICLPWPEFVLSASPLLWIGGEILLISYPFDCHCCCCGYLSYLGVPEITVISFEEVCSCFIRRCCLCWRVFLWWRWLTVDRCSFAFESTLLFFRQYIKTKAKIILRNTDIPRTAPPTIVADKCPLTRPGKKTKDYGI